MDNGPTSGDSRGEAAPVARRFRVRAAVVGVLVSASALAACATTIDGPGSYADSSVVSTTGAGPSGTGVEVPDPTQATVSTTPSTTSAPPTTTSKPTPKPTTVAPNPAQDQCQSAWIAAQSFLPDWNAATATPSPTAEVRQALAVKIGQSVASVQAIVNAITEPGLTAHFNALITEMNKLAALVSNGAAATLDQYKVNMDVVQQYCGF